MIKRLALYAMLLPALVLLLSGCARDLSARTVSDGVDLSVKVDWRAGTDVRYWWEVSANGGGWTRASQVRDPGRFRTAAKKVPVTERLRRSCTTSSSCSVYSLSAGASYRYRFCADLQAPKAVRNVCFPGRSAFTAASAPAPAPAAGPAPFFRGDFNTGNVSQFANVQCAPGRLTVGSDRQARFEVREGDREPQTGHEGRCESIPGTDIGDGREVWQRFSVTFAPGFSTANWLMFAQWHGNGGGGSPPVAFMVEGRSNRLFVAHGGGGARYWTGPTLQTGRRYDFASHIRFSDSSSSGFVELWLDGQRQTMQGGGQRAYGPTSDSSSGSVYPKFGIYRSRSDKNNVVLYGDNFLLGNQAGSIGLTP